VCEIPKGKVGIAMGVDERANGGAQRPLGLRELLEPISVGEFLRDYWGKKPLYVEASRSDKFATLFDLERFRSAIRDEKTVKLRGSLDSGASYFSVRGGDVDTLLKGGATLCADHLEETDNGLRACTGMVARELRYPGKVDFRCYLSPDGAGFDTHFDQRIATVLQIAGQKRWRFSRQPAVDYPEYQAVPDGKGGVKHGRTLHPAQLAAGDFVPPNEAEFEEVVLRPGDVLCLPAGTWHKAKAIGWSLALNLAFNPVRVHELVWTTIRKHLESDPIWRQGIVPVPAENVGPDPQGSGETLGHYMRRLRKVLEELEGIDAGSRA
jgi:ribosomal protein L16 Arg81 hydroxylase